MSFLFPLTPISSHLYMFHGSHSQEFSSEILLSLVEMTQFQESLQKYYGDHFTVNIDDMMLDKQYWIEYPHSRSFPRSAIVYDHKHKNGINSSRISGALHNLKQVVSISASPRSCSGPHVAALGMYLDSNAALTPTASNGSATSAASNGSAASAASSGSNVFTGTDIEMTRMEESQERPAESLEPLEKDKIQEYIKKAQGIYMKYIDVSSPFEVNVSYQTRKHVMDTLNEMEFVDGTGMDAESQKMYFRKIYKLFMPTMNELHILLASSYSRFKSTSLFHKLVSDD